MTIDVSGNVTGQVGEVPARAGSDIRLTIDVNIQKACEDGLAYAIEVAHRAGYGNAQCGACVCLDCTRAHLRSFGIRWRRLV